MTEVVHRSIGDSPVRREAELKVTGAAPYAFEHEVEQPLYLHAVLSTIARGEIASVDDSAARTLDGVTDVITHQNAPRLASADNRELYILQEPQVAFRGQIVGAVIAESAEAAREGAAQVRLEYAEQPHDVELRVDHPDLYAPEQVNPSYETDTSVGDVNAALDGSAIVIDRVYTTPPEFNNPMEPHATIAIHDGSSLTLYDSTQGPYAVRSAIAPLFGLDEDQVHVIAPYVGGGFGSKGTPHAHIVLAGLAAMTVPGRPVKLALTRQQMFGLVGYRTPTIQRVRLGCDRDGLLQAISHDVFEETSKVKEFAEQTAVVSRMMYAAAAARSTSHRLAPLDLPVPSWMRAPGEAPGMFAPEVALDELAEELGLDPIELRVRNEPETDPESGKPWSTRLVVDCLQQGAARFGWSARAARPREVSRDGWLIGMGVASATYPVNRMPGSSATVVAREGGIYGVQIAAADIGQGAWTSLAQIAADALSVGLEQIELEIGDSHLPSASVAGGSSGTTTWGSAIIAAASAFRSEHGSNPEAGASSSAETPENPDQERYSMHAFGAHFAEAHVHEETGEIRVPRLLGVYDAGTIINPRLARSQFRGGMTMGLSMALHEHGIIDPQFGHVVNHDLAEYHVPVHADVAEIDVMWLDSFDPYTNPMGSKGIGEIGIVGTAAAVVNAIYNATGIRVRDLPVTPDKVMRAAWAGAVG